MALLRLFLVALTISVVLGNDAVPKMEDISSILASIRSDIELIVSDARNAFASDVETAEVPSRNQRRQNPTACLGSSSIENCGNCDIRGVFLNTTSQTKAVDSVPGGAVTMNYFDQFNNRPSTPNLFLAYLFPHFSLSSSRQYVSTCSQNCIHLQFGCMSDF
jgi:hypothetical protein